MTAPWDAPAPGELALVQRLVNTWQAEDPDDLGDLAGLTAWLSESGLAAAGEHFAEADRRRLVDLREGLRSLLLANHGAELDRDAVHALGQAARAAPLVVAFDAGGNARLTPARTGVDGVLATLLGIVARAQADGTWPRLKACPGAGCGAAFYDRSRNRSRTWCEMSTCGNRAKARSYRARHR